jgi:hypothetical protein
MHEATEGGVRLRRLKYELAQLPDPNRYRLQKEPPTEVKDRHNDNRR